MAPTGSVGWRPDGLESVKKTDQVAAHGVNPPVRAVRRPPLFTERPTIPRRLGLASSGYVIDDGPRNEAPGDAGCGVSRGRGDRSDRDILVSQPGRLAPGGGSANPRRHRP